MPHEGTPPTQARVVTALAAAPVAALVAMLAWDDTMWAVIYGRYNEFGTMPFLILFGYVPALFMTLLVGAPAWLLLHRLRATHVIVFIVVGMAVSLVILLVVAGHRIHVLTPPFLLGPLIGGAIAGWVLHRIGYPRRSA
jgi:hypothetical protein